MKILHVINGLSIGGTENLMVNHVRQLAHAAPEIDNEACVLGARAEAAPDYLARLPVEPVFLNLPADYRRPAVFARYLKALRSVIRISRPDIVHSYLWKSDLFGALATFGLGVRQGAHVLDRRGAANDPRTLLTGWALRRKGARFPAVSDACRTHAIRNYRLKPDRVVTAHNGIDADAFTPAGQPVFSAAEPHFGTISRFADEKGQSYLVDAFEKLAARYPEARLTMAGGGSGLERMRAMVATRGLAGHIMLPGRVESAADFYRSLDAFVIPSTHAEGLPTTILEAMASGLPVVATDVGGAIEAVRDGREGLIVPPRDAAAIAEAMAALLEDPKRARAMGAAGRERVGAAFTLEAMTRTILDRVYRPLMAERAGGAPA